MDHQSKRGTFSSLTEYGIDQNGGMKIRMKIN